jgi:hypothetical protein
VPGHEFTYHQVARLLATKATRALWDALRQRFRDRVDPSLWDADCLFDDLAYDHSSAAQPLGVRCRPATTVPATSAPQAPPAAAACYVRSAPMFARAKNFPEHDVALTDSGATIKGYVGNALGNGTRSWDLPGSRLCPGDQVVLTIRASGQLDLVSRFWMTSGTTESSSGRLQHFPPPWPDREFLAMSPGGDLSGTTGTRTYRLTVTDYPFSIGVWVYSSQGDAGVVIWSYAADKR